MYVIGTNLYMLYVYMCDITQHDDDMGWLRLVGSLKS